MALNKRSSGSANYARKLKDPRWQKKRLEIFQRDNFSCQNCGSISETLHVHHKFYRRSDPWDCPSIDLVTLCEPCHTSETYQRSEAEGRLLMVLKKAGLFTSHLEEMIEYYENQNKYYDCLSDEQWQSREKELLNKDGACFICYSKQNLVVHHKHPNVVLDKPWNLSEENFELICKSCKKQECNNISDELILLSTLRWAGFYREDILDLASRYDLKTLKNEIRRYRKEGINNCFLESDIPEEENVTYEKLLKLNREIEQIKPHLVLLEKQARE